MNCLNITVSCAIIFMYKEKLHFILYFKTVYLIIVLLINNRYYILISYALLLNIVF